MPRVLLVDDDPQVLRLLRLNFEMEDYDVVTARDGDEALDAIAKEELDLIVCDVMMPGVDGLEVAAVVKGQGSRVPFILLSAKAQKADIRAGEAAGADAYITKPFDPNELLQVAARLIR